MSFSFQNPDLARFSADQKAGYDTICSGRNVCLSGPAGTGKSTILNALKKKYGMAMSVTASTGIAALNIGGSTIHSFAGLRLAREPIAELIKIVKANKRARENIMGCAMLVIEEISMISAELLDKIDQVFRAIRKSKQPMGGVRCIFLGDFLQLPPVDKRDENSDKPPVGFAFESNFWREGKVETIFLTKVHRQSDQAFVDALLDLRQGIKDSPRLDIIYARNTVPIPTEGIRPMIIDTHNASVDRINATELDRLTTKAETFHAIDDGEMFFREKLDKDCLAPKILVLKPGAQVMLLKNLNLEEGLANGSMGKVLKCSSGSVTVEFGSGSVHEIVRAKWELLNGQQVLASREQFPLRLAYALTAHKVQGLTLDKILVRMGKAFESGQAYVALSRVRTLEGLYLSNFTPSSILVHPRALLFYQNGGKLLDQDDHMEQMLENEQAFLNFDAQEDDRRAS